MLQKAVATQDLDQLAINTIRTLSMDTVQQANSRHPGTPMALAPVAYCIWQRFLRFDPEDPMQTFGASAPLEALQTKFGFLPDGIAPSVRELLGK